MPDAGGNRSTEDTCAPAGPRATALSSRESFASSPLAATVDFQSPPLAVAPGEAFTVSFSHRFSFEADGDTSFDGGAPNGGDRSTEGVLLSRLQVAF